MKIAFVEMDEWEKEVSKAFKDKDIIESAERLTLDNVDKFKDTEILSIFVNSHITKDILDKLPNLKMIAARSTGFDHIDIDECKRRGIIVSNVPVYGMNTVAEQTFGLILSLTRRLPESFERMKRCDFDYAGLRGMDIAGKTIGVIGGGNIGQYVIKIANGFGMNILVFDIKKDEALAERLNFKYVEVDELLKESDIVSLHLPLNKHTFHIINKDNIMNMKKGAILINTCRGAVVETEALVKALDEGLLYGAGLDVIEGEKEIKEEIELLRSDFKDKTEKELKVLLEDHILLEHENVLMTPHNAFNTHEAVKRIIDTSIDNIDSFMKGTPKNTVV